MAKAAGKVCVRLPGRSGRRFSRVWDVPARTGAITEVAERRTGADSIRFIHREFATKCANPADTAGACSGHDGNI